MAVEFEEQNSSMQQFTQRNEVNVMATKEPFFVRMLLKTKIIKTPFQANVVLFILSLVLILVAVVVFLKAYRGYVFVRPQIDPQWLKNDVV
jgi:hypothetical protein